MRRCRTCQAVLCSDEVALYRKLIRRDADTFLCKQCLAGELHCPTELLDRKIEQFRANGCFLFAPADSARFFD